MFIDYDVLKVRSVALLKIYILGWLASIVGLTALGVSVIFIFVQYQSFTK